VGPRGDRDMWKTIAILVVAVFALGGLVAAALRLDRPVERAATASATQPVWNEVTWPFPIDQWGRGKAFRCTAADCGAEVNVYIRAKIGFCNCSTGVSDDEELDRISDFDLFHNTLSPIAPGREISVAWMKGRSRPFSIRRAQAAKSALSIGFNDRCDAIIATAVLGHNAPADFESVVIEFLNSRTVIRWAEVTLGL
jgi:hypothetical protein